MRDAGKRTGRRVSRPEPHALRRALQAALAAAATAGATAAWAQIIPTQPVSTQPVSPQTAETEAAAPQAAAGAPTPICTDRPTKSNSACTVDPGHLQYESDIANASFLKLDGVTTDTVLLTNPTLKYGLAPRLDVEADLSPLEIVQTHVDGGGTRTLAGVGDLYLRLKYEFLDLAGGALAAAAIPYVKAPTARPGIGDGAVEGGVIVPLNLKLGPSLTLTTAPELDDLKDAADAGRHLATAQLVNLAMSLPGRFTAYAELWADWNYDPAGVIRQRSADFALAYGATPQLQLDAGLNLGLNRRTAGVQAYLGASQKF